MLYPEPPRFTNGNGTFEIEWVEFDIDQKDWKGDKGGTLMWKRDHEDRIEWYIKTCNNGDLYIGPWGVLAESIRKPAHNQYDRLVRSLTK